MKNRVHDYAARLQTHEPAGNEAIKAKLDELPADHRAPARRFHEQRQ
ncbi:MAG TPA: hypothetical protein VJL29_07560 [Thermoguttaceae bacterium]|nr:hypothetical protein [Thermoguttaceae bacterium]